MWQVFEKIGQEFLRAVATDIASLAENEQVYREASFLAGKALGVDVTSGFVRPYWDDAYSRGMAAVRQAVETAAQYPDETADLIKEKSARFADSFAEALKKRNEQKQTEATDV